MPEGVAEQRVSVARISVAQAASQGSLSSASVNSKTGEQTRGEIAVLRLGAPGERAVVLTPARMKSLAEELGRIAADPSVRALVIAGPGPGIFCAGADINIIKDVTDKQRGTELAKEGQRIFDLLEKCGKPTVCAIYGACVGGGYEMALACDHRIACDSPETRVGLPEVKLGILPGFGGSQRLPRLIGLPSALDIILKGKVVTAEKAFKQGLVDWLFRPTPGSDPEGAYSQLLDFAVRVAGGAATVPRRKISVQDRFLTYFGLGRGIVTKRAKAALLRETKGNYPAPLKALEIAVDGLALGKAEGLKREAEALGELIITPESKALVHVFQLTEECTKRWRQFKGVFEKGRVGVIGGGTMGAGIAAAIVLNDGLVTLVEPVPQVQERARAHICSIVAKRKGEAAANNLDARLEITDKLDHLSGCELVIEAIIESLEAKRSLFAGLSKIVSETCIIGSNTSSLPISEFAGSVDHPGRVIGLHFFNPAEKMPLVEVVQLDSSSERTIAVSAAFAVKLGKYPIVVSEVPGFLVNRILSPYLLEAGYALRDGYKIHQIDSAALTFGMPMGPLRLTDEVGLDVAAKVAEIIGSSYGPRMQGPNYPAQLTATGRLGRKNSRGFYTYSENGEQEDVGVYAALALPDSPTGNAADLQDRLILSLVNEAVRAYDEQVAGAPSKEAAGQVDLGTVMGLGFAPFRGGVLHYAEHRGFKAIAQRLDDLAKLYGERFEPAPGIKRRAASGERLW